ncbi:aminotransferase class V-fold PLP-dependent enzyme [Spiractinospora alimapuensis]|uniref:aminotransferase class V-fold PLP-dependent enzyme n=1 Tax=Spiractinospora alimapuensis TaxID=2820884 RepID=UPI001F1E7A05|nr:aminotransferase class V-fold PLP-dependent enzyme [Spiractinospora alimapuensis]QVQ51861.1 aminotransferase class V-fold PLP-dependent enzyme [Spiractinospora alimapuensis]
MTSPGRATRVGHFPDLEGSYLDTATQGVGPRAAAVATAHATQKWARGVADHTRWEERGEEARARVAELLDVHAADVALVPSQVAAATIVAQALREATVVVPEQEYRANLLPWTQSRPRSRARIVAAPATTDRLLDAIDDGVDLVAVSSVQSADGLRVDLPRVVDHAHRHGALVYVDASQSFGVDADLAGSGADVIAAVGYKWLLGPRGVCYLMVRSGLREKVAPLLASPESAADARHYGSDYRPWPDARRFDQPLAWPALVGATAGLDLLSGFPTSVLDTHSVELGRRMRDGLATAGIAVAPEDQPSPIIAVPDRAPARTVAGLAAMGVRAAARAHLVRFSFHLFNDSTDVDAALHALTSVRQRSLEQK